MKIKCELDSHSCVLPDYIAQFIVNASIMYSNTIDSHGNPRIQPIIFINEPGKCNIAFLAKKGSMIVSDIEKNSKIALTTDITHPINPSLNTGIMIEAVSELVSSQKEVEQCFDNLQNKYSIDIVSKILGIDIILSYIKIKAFPLKIVFWKGPFFKRFICKRKKEILNKTISHL